MTSAKPLAAQLRPVLMVLNCTARMVFLSRTSSPWFNQRTDEWGGSLANRMRFPLEVVREVRRVIETHARKPFLLRYRGFVE
jgi:2,4-dienoyl-CoA reductase-like NADH-dependent reductase (Old Yellow Enzyme family)